MTSTYIKIKVLKDAKVKDCMEMIENFKKAGLVDGEPEVFLETRDYRNIERNINAWDTSIKSWDVW